jgi:hypothetical protein
LEFTLRLRLVAQPPPRMVDTWPMSK